MVGRRLYIYILAVAVVLAAIFLPGFSRLRDMRERTRRIEEENERLRKANAELEETIRRLKEDPSYIEGRARDKMGVVRAGEIVYKEVIPTNEQDDKSNDEQ